MNPKVVVIGKMDGSAGVNVLCVEVQDIQHEGAIVGKVLPTLKSSEFMKMFLKLTVTN
ncbi:MAG: hypothetical protein ABL933_14140 [Methyloglobulus sp.]|nr:hypothetical protein [Methyloglobulus sp.]